MFTTILAVLLGVLVYTVTDPVPGFHPVWSVVCAVVQMMAQQLVISLILRKRSNKINQLIQESMAETQQKLKFLVDYTMLQIDEYIKHGFEIKGIIGANRSPNCGVETTSDNDVEISGMGVFMDALSKKIKSRGLSIPMTGIKGSDNIEDKLKKLI